MTGEMSKFDLTVDGEWGLFVETANLIDGAELRPFDKYQGPYMLYNGHKLWFTEMEVLDDGSTVQGIYDERLDYFHINSFTYDSVSPEDLAREIIETFGPE